MRLASLMLALALGGLVAGAARPSGSAFPGRNGLIAFRSDQSRGIQIWTMKPDGTAMKRLTSRSAGAAAPAWAPDGRRIAFVSPPGGRVIDLYVLDSASGRDRRLTSGLKVRLPSWSPDGTRIAFARTQGSRQEIYVIGADGSGLHRLLAAPKRGFDDAPAWSPDGRRIAFTRYTGRGVQRRVCIGVVGASGSGLRTIGCSTSRLSLISDVEPSWSPDGRKIAFNRFRNARTNIWVMSADGSGLRVLTRSGADSQPAWSPDGRRIVFASTRARHPEIYVMNADGTRTKRLTVSVAIDTEPDWQRLR